MQHRKSARLQRNEAKARKQAGKLEQDKLELESKLAQAKIDKETREATIWNITTMKEYAEATEARAEKLQADLDEIKDKAEENNRFIISIYSQLTNHKHVQHKDLTDLRNLNDVMLLDIQSMLDELRNGLVDCKELIPQLETEIDNGNKASQLLLTITDRNIKVIDNFRKGE